MKILRTFSGQEFVLEDDEAENIIKVKNTGNGKAFIGLRCGAYVDAAAIESISEIPLIPFSRDGHRLSKDGRSFVRDGQRVYVEDLEGIQYLPDPKYKNIAKQLSDGKAKD